MDACFNNYGPVDERSRYCIFYGGLSKRKNVLNTMFLSLIAFAIASLIWLIFGYQFSFASSSIGGFIGVPQNLFLEGLGVDSLTGSIPTFVFIAFELTFVALTAAIVSVQSLEE